MTALSDLAYLCYDAYMQAGRLPQEIDGTDICAWLRVCGWRAARRQEKKKTRKKQLFIDDVMK